MKRLGRALAAAVAVGLLLGVLLAAGGGEDGGYKVRAVFDNASFVIPGEDVKVAGVKVGKIADVDLEEDHRAAVVLQIDDPAFRPFRRDAHCQIRLQSLIGEQYVECEPTRKRDGGARPPAPLKRIESGRGEGQHLLPVENTTTPVAVDLITNVTRLPERERLRLIINELGAGLAGNGARLRAALRRANPALRELTEVIGVLADQDRLLARLVDESDQVLAAWAPRRRETAHFIDRVGVTAAATAERGDDLERDFEKLPPFLRELGPTADRFTALANEMRPALAILDRQAPAINETVARLGPFTEAMTPALDSLGDFAQRGRRLFPEIRPLIRDLGEVGDQVRPLAGDLDAFATSFDDSGGVEELMRFIFLYTSAVNGEDEFGHYVRSGLNITPCVRLGVGSLDCTANFVDEEALDSGSAASSPRPPARDEAMLDYLLGPEAER